MSLLATHLWREWRTHRRTLIALALILPTLIAAMLLMTGDLTGALSAEGSQVVVWAPIMCCAAALLSIGSDLFASERRRGGDLTLARIPGALNFAFVARLVLFYGAMIGALIYGDVIAALFCGAKPVLLTSMIRDGSTLTLPLLALASWMFCCSTWVSSSALSGPVCFLFLAFVTIPIPVGFSFGATPSPENAIRVVLFTVPMCAGPFVGWYSFAYGRRGGRTSDRAVRVGVIIGVLLFMPSWIWAGGRSLMSAAPQPVVTHALLGEGGRYLFLNLGDGPDPTAYTSAILDFDSGELERVGITGRSAWGSCRALQGLKPGSTGRGAPVLEHYDDNDLPGLHHARSPFAWPQLVSDALHKRRGLPFVASLYDGSTGKLLGSSKEQRMADFWNPLALPELDTSNSRVTAAGSGFRLGRRFAPGPKPTYWDPQTAAHVDLSVHEETLGSVGPRDVVITPFGWVIETGTCACQLYDPVVGELKPLEGVPRDARLKAALDDGSLIFITGDHPYRFDLATHKLTRLDVVCDSNEPLNWRWVFAGTVERPPLSANRPTVVKCLAHISGDNSHEARREGFALFDPTRNNLRILSLGRSTARYGNPRVLAHGDGFTLVTETGQRILRVDWDTGDTTPVYDFGRLDQ